MKELFKKSKEDLLSRWDGGGEVLERIEKRSSPLLIQYASVLALASLFIFSVHYFPNSEVTTQDIQLSDFYGDEDESSVDELQDSYDFYDDMV